VVGEVNGYTVCCIGTYKLYFCALFDTKFTDVQTTDSTVQLAFSTEANEQIQLKVGLSPVSIAEARRLISVQASGWNFDSVENSARREWNDLLHNIEVNGREDIKTLFYTHLFRSCMLPMFVADSGAPYAGTDCQIYTSEHSHYNGWSTWDTFRTKFPLYTLMAPQRLQDMLQSAVKMYQQGKHWSAGDCEPVPTVRTEHMVSIFADALRKGLSEFDAVEAFPYIVTDVKGVH
jgi:putative alpha-1,2-mannosidase